MSNTNANEVPVKEKKQRRKMTDDTRNEILNAFMEGKDFLAIGKQKGFCDATIYKSLKPRKKDITNSMGRKPKLTLEQVKCILNILEESPQLGLEEIITKMQQQGIPKVTPSTLFKYLDTKLIIDQKIVADSTTRNTENIKDDRIEFCKWLFQNKHKKFIYVGEFGCNCYTVHRYGKNLKVVTPVIGGCQQVGTKQSVAAAISKDFGLIDYQIIDGNYSSEVFSNDFLRKIAEKLKQDHANDWDSFVIILDKTTTHLEGDVKNVLNSVEIEYKFLPQYTYCLNPIEKCFDMWIEQIKLIMSTEKAEELSNSTKFMWLRRTMIRRKILQEVIRNVSDVITVEKCTKWVENTYLFFSKIDERQDL